jgi:hypothetical protein
MRLPVPFRQSTFDPAGDRWGRVIRVLGIPPPPLGSAIRQKRMRREGRTNIVQSRRLPPADRGEVTLPAGAQAHG